MIDHFHDSKQVNVSQLFPNQIVGDIGKTVSSTEKMVNMNNNPPNLSIQFFKDHVTRNKL